MIVEMTSRHAIRIPEIGAGNEPIRISNWLVEEGEQVVTGDRLVELLTPGVTFDLAGEHTGVIDEITHPVNTVIHVDDIIGWIATD